jgi:hypothetical protein
MPSAVEASPQIMILSGRKVLPTASLKVRICSHSKIGSMDVRMRPVGMNHVRKSEALRND